MGAQGVYQKKYAKSHKEELRQYKKDWRNINITKIREIERKRSAQFRKKHPAHVSNIHRRYRIRNYDKVDKMELGQRLKKKYGLTIKQYDDMFKSQDGKCMICLIPQSELVKRFAVDHSHRTGKIRGLLCESCNGGLGMFKDSPELLKMAIVYLRRSNGSTS
jgi:hypothetical protein